MPVTFATPDDLATIVERLVALESDQVNLAPVYSRLNDLEARVTALETTDPPPPPPPPPPPSTGLNLSLLGGYRLAGPFARGQLAIDHANRKAYMTGQNEVYEYDLPAHGTGEDISQWPALQPVRVIPRWWPEEEGYSNGLIVRNGDVWACPRRFYDMAQPSITKAYSLSGSVETYPLPRQQFAGYVKSANGFEIGCGGYESGQGSAFGPTLAKPDGTILINHTFDASWESREARPANYYPADGKDSWVCLTPRNGEGRWACDNIQGGGLRFSHGIYYWCSLGINALDYSLQSECFATYENIKTYLYRYDPATYQLMGWQEFPFAFIRGQDISPDGRLVYLTQGDAWTSGMYKVDPVLRIYEVQ